MSDNVNPFGQPGQQPTSAQPAGSTNPFANGPVAPTTTPAAPVTPTGPASPAASGNPFPATTPQPGTTDSTSPFGTTTLPPTPSVQVKKKTNVKMLVGIIVGVVALLAIIITVVVVVMGGQPTADDYDAAYDATKDITTAVSDITRDVDFSSDATESEMIEMADTVIAAVDTGQSKIDELGKMAAITKDNEAKELFDTLNSKYGDMGAKVKEMMNNFKQIAPVMAAMYQISDMSYSDRSDYQVMAANFKNLADAASGATIDNADLKGAVDKIASASQSISNYYQQAAGGNIPDYDIISDAQDDYYDAQDVLSDVFSVSDLYDLSGDVDDAQYDLADYLWDQSFELSE